MARIPRLNKPRGRGRQPGDRSWLPTLAIVVAVALAALMLWSAAGMLNAGKVTDEEFAQVERGTARLSEISDDLDDEILAYDASPGEVADAGERLQTVTKDIRAAEARLDGAEALEKDGALAAAYQSFGLAVSRYASTTQTYEEALMHIYPLTAQTYAALAEPDTAVQELRQVKEAANIDIELRAPGNVEVRGVIAELAPKLIWITKRLGEPAPSPDPNPETGATEAADATKDESGPSREWLTKRLDKRTGQLDDAVTTWHADLRESYMDARKNFASRYAELQTTLDERSGA